MKNLKLISLFPLLIFLISLFLPYVAHEAYWRQSSSFAEYGYEFAFVYVPLSIMILILLIVNVWRTRFVAIVSFVLCFGILFTFFLLQFEMIPVEDTFEHDILYGYIVGLFSIPTLMVILLVNLVKIFNQSKRNSESNS